MRAAATLAFALAVALVAACDYEGASKDDFVSEGNAICESTGATVIPALEALQDEGEVTTAELRSFVGDVAAPALQRRLDQLRGLEPPSDDTDAVAVLIRTMQKGIDAIRADPRELVDGDPFLEANVEARSYGLSSCVLRGAGL